MTFQVEARLNHVIDYFAKAIRCAKLFWLISYLGVPLKGTPQIPLKGHHGF